MLDVQSPRTGASWRHAALGTLPDDFTDMRPSIPRRPGTRGQHPAMGRSSRSSRSSASWAWRRRRMGPCISTSRAPSAATSTTSTSVGTTVYLPVFADGGLFSTGDGHGVQGDGEVNLTALETALTGTFRFTVRKDMKLNNPRAETRDALDHPRLRPRPRRRRQGGAARHDPPDPAKTGLSAPTPTCCAACRPTCTSPRRSTATRASTAFSRNRACPGSSVEFHGNLILRIAGLFQRKFQNA